MVASWCQHFPPNFRQNNIGPAEEMIASWWQYFPANRKKENITTNRSSGGHAVGAKIFLFSAKLQKKPPSQEQQCCQLVARFSGQLQEVNFGIVGKISRPFLEKRKSS
jgi:hypothetical protein